MVRRAEIELAFKKSGRGDKESISNIDRISKGLRMLKKEGANLANIAHAANISGKELATMGSHVDKLGTTARKSFDTTLDGLKKVRREMDFTFLSLLFVGMALQRLGSSIIKSLAATFTMVRGEHNKLTENVNQMKASFEFLKFSIIDAFVNSGLLEDFRKVVVKMFDAISGFVTKHPNWASGFVKFAAALVAIGVAMQAGSLVLQIEEVAVALGILNKGVVLSFVTKGITAAKAAISSLMAHQIAGTTVGSLLKIGATAFITFMIVDQLAESLGFSDLASKIAGLLGAGITVGMIGIGGVPAIPAAMVGIGLTILPLTSFKLGKELGKIHKELGFVEALKSIPEVFTGSSAEEVIRSQSSRINIPELETKLKVRVVYEEG